jgi:hypothetical protein
MNILNIFYNKVLRRDTYEDYSYPLANVTGSIQQFDSFSLRTYAKHGKIKNKLRKYFIFFVVIY